MKKSLVCFTAVLQYWSKTSKIIYAWLKRAILTMVTEKNSDMLVCPMCLSIQVDYKQAVLFQWVFQMLSDRSLRSTFLIWNKFFISPLQLFTFISNCLLPSLHPLLHSRGSYWSWFDFIVTRLDSFSIYHFGKIMLLCCCNYHCCIYCTTLKIFFVSALDFW